MGQFTFTKTKIDGAQVIEPRRFGDSRGYFMETYNHDDFSANGIDVQFIQDNQSKSVKGVLRGMHFQTRKPQCKLVRVIKGQVFDVAMDIRPESVTYGQWEGVLLTDDNFKQFYIPAGCAHGFLVLSDEAEFVYKCTDVYDPGFEGGLAYNDPSFNVEWPISEDMILMLSDKDMKYDPFNLNIK